MADDTPIEWVSISTAAAKCARSASTVNKWTKEACTACVGEGCDRCHDGATVRTKRDGYRIFVCLQDCYDRITHAVAAAPRRNKPGEMLISQWAAEVGVSESRAKQMRHEGEIENYSPEEAERVKLLRADRNPRSDHGSVPQDELRSAKARREHYQAEIARLNYEQAAKKLVEAKAAIAVISNIADICRSEMRGLVHSVPFSVSEIVRPHARAETVHEVEAAVRAVVISLVSDAMDKIAETARSMEQEE